MRRWAALRVTQVTDRSEGTIDPLHNDGCARIRLLALVNRLADPQLEPTMRLEVVEQIQILPNHAILCIRKPLP